MNFLDEMFKDPNHKINLYLITFLIYDCFPNLLEKFVNHFFNMSVNSILPPNYKVNPISGTLLDDALNINDEYFSFGISKHDLYHFYKKYNDYLYNIHNGSLVKNNLKNLNNDFMTRDYRNLENRNNEFKKRNRKSFFNYIDNTRNNVDFNKNLSSYV